MSLLSIKPRLSTLLKTVVYSTAYLFTGFLLASAYFWPSVQENHYPLLRLTIIFFAGVLLSKYFFYMIICPWNDVRNKLIRRSFGRPLSRRPESSRVSVLVPAWNEEVGIVTTLETLLRSDYKNTELLVIDNASTDETAKRAQDFITDYYQNIDRDSPHIDIVYLYEGNQGKGHALNKGIQQAQGEIIISIDGDCSVTPGAVSAFVDAFVDPKVMAAVGNVKIGNTDSILGIIQYLEFLFSFYFKKCDSIFNTIYIIGGAAGAFRKEVFQQIGGYSTKNITEDIELSIRIQKAGMKIVYVSDALVYTEGATTLSGLFKQRLRWKRGRFETFIEHREFFFSTENRHNKILTWIMLPLSLFGEIQLFCELFFLAFLYWYSYLTNDFSSFISGIAIVASMFFIQIFFDNRGKNSLEFYLLAPIGWLLFYLTTFIEFRALVESLWGYLRGTTVQWQKWQRTGVFSNPK